MEPYEFTFEAKASLTAIENNENLNNTIEIWPNPFRNLVYIKLPCIKDEKKVSIISLNGEIIVTSITKDEEILEMNLENLPNGFYFITIYSIGQTLQNKLIIKNR